MMMQHGCARGTREKLTKFLAAQTRGRNVVERPHCSDAWERKDHLLIRVEEKSESLSQMGPECWCNTL